MKRVISYILVVLIFSCTFPIVQIVYPISEIQWVKFESIDYPDEITISNNFKQEELNRNISIKYNYLGEDIVPKTGFHRKYKCSIQYQLDGLILYIDDSGQFLPRAFDYYRTHGLDTFFYSEIISGHTGYIKIFKRDEVNRIDMDIFDPFIYSRMNETDIMDSIKKQSLSEILIIIKDIDILWELEYPLNPDKLETKSGIFKLEINRILNIKVKFKDEK